MRFDTGLFDTGPLRRETPWRIRHRNLVFVLRILARGFRKHLDTVLTRSVRGFGPRDSREQYCCSDCRRGEQQVGRELQLVRCTICSERCTAAPCVNRHLILVVGKLRRSGRDSRSIQSEPSFRSVDHRPSRSVTPIVITNNLMLTSHHRQAAAGTWFCADLLRRINVSLRVRLGAVPTGSCVPFGCPFTSFGLHLLLIHGVHDTRIRPLHPGGFTLPLQ